MLWHIQWLWWWWLCVRKGSLSLSIRSCPSYRAWRERAAGKRDPKKDPSSCVCTSHHQNSRRKGLYSFPFSFSLTHSPGVISHAEASREGRTVKEPHHDSDKGRKRDSDRPWMITAFLFPPSRVFIPFWHRVKVLLEPKAIADLSGKEWSSVVVL